MHFAEQTSESQRLTTHKSRSRKAANLAGQQCYCAIFQDPNIAELQRYFDAAAEAASEVMQLESASKIKIDLKHLANAGIKPLDSPRYFPSCAGSNTSMGIAVEWSLLIWQVAMPHFEKSSDRNLKHPVELRAKSMSAQKKAQ